MNEPNQTPPAKDGVHPLARPFLWLDAPLFRTVLPFVFGGLAGLLLLLEFLLPEFSAGKYTEALGVYEIEGFVGLVLIVLVCWPLRWLLGRRANFYGQDGDDA
jgi:hypothetical protein